MFPEGLAGGGRMEVARWARGGRVADAWWARDGRVAGAQRFGSAEVCDVDSPTKRANGLVGEFTAPGTVESPTKPRGRPSLGI